MTELVCVVPFLTSIFWVPFHSPYYSPWVLSVLWRVREVGLITDACAASIRHVNAVPGMKGAAGPIPVAEWNSSNNRKVLQPRRGPAGWTYEFHTP